MTTRQVTVVGAAAHAERRLGTLLGVARKKAQDAGLDTPSAEEAPRDIMGNRIRVGDRIALCVGGTSPQLVVRRVLGVSPWVVQVPAVDGVDPYWAPEAVRRIALVLS